MDTPGKKRKKHRVSFFFFFFFFFFKRNSTDIWFKQNTLGGFAGTQLGKAHPNFGFGLSLAEAARKAQAEIHGVGVEGHEPRSGFGQHIGSRPIGGFSAFSCAFAWLLPEGLDLDGNQENKCISEGFCPACFNGIDTVSPNISAMLHLQLPCSSHGPSLGLSIQLPRSDLELISDLLGAKLARPKWENSKGHIQTQPRPSTRPPAGCGRAAPNSPGTPRAKAPRARTPRPTPLRAMLLVPAAAG